ncbi:MAG: hypothetical protein AB7F75_07970 [Planctomycetota bacterium]
MLLTRPIAIAVTSTILGAIFYFGYRQNPEDIPQVVVPSMPSQPMIVTTPAKAPPSDAPTLTMEIAPPAEDKPPVVTEPEVKVADPSLRMKIYLPKNYTPRNGFLVLAPRKWRADQDSEFNPLLPKYKAPWAASLRKPWANEIVIDDLPRDSYQLLVYRNDGGDHKAPTCVHILDMSSGGFCNLDEPALQKVDPVN